MSRVVVDLRDRRPIWEIPEWALDELKEALPDDWELWVASTFADGSGDGGRGGTAPEVLEALRGARVYMGYGVPPTVLEAGGDTLEWVHTGAAGVGGSLHEAMKRSPVRFTNSAGMHAPPMADTVVGMLLHFYRGFDFAVRGQAERRWETDPFFAPDTPVRELGADTVGIVGYGGIGREVARRLRPFGTRVLGLKRRPPPSVEVKRAAPESTSSGPRSGRPVDELGTELLHGEEGLRALLEESDAVVVSVPETPATRGLLSAERLARLRDGALLVNVARGRVVDEEALVEALREGRLRGAGLDVFHTEPLPSDAPLWTLPNVLITPHVSAVSHTFWRREMDLILENLRRFLAGGAGALLNEVDRERGY